MSVPPAEQRLHTTRLVPNLLVVGTAAVDKIVALDVVGRSRRALGYAVLTLFMSGGENPVATTAIRLTLRPTPQCDPFAGFPAAAVAVGYAGK